jgi:multidrug efflux pump
VKGVLSAAFGRARTITMLLVLLLIAGTWSYGVIPREAQPEITIPIFVVTLPYPGISPEDAERLLAQPLERRLQRLAGVDTIRSWSTEGLARVRVDFQAGHDASAALADVREEVDLARALLPPGSEEPVIREVDPTLFPVLTINLSGGVPERTLVRTAQELRDRIETVPGVLEAFVTGARSEVIEIVADPVVMETYRISHEALAQAIQRNHRLVAVGAIDTGVGRIAVRVPGTIESVEDILRTSVIAVEGTVVTLGDIADVRQTFRDPEGFTRIDGEPSVALRVRNRPGTNVIRTVAAVKDLVADEQARWPPNLQVTYTQDRSESIERMLSDLQNNIITAVGLVLLATLAILGSRAGVLVALAIPGSFLAGILGLSLFGYTFNIVVVFGLILVVGMLVDGAIIVVEQADRNLAEGMPREEAFLRAAQRMSWPIIAATATTLAVFIPLLLWPGAIGQFFRFLPVTVMVTLSASLLMALVFIPVLGAIAGPRSVANPKVVEQVRAAEAGELDLVGGATGHYLRVLRAAIERPGATLLLALAVTGTIYIAYSALGRGMQFFPRIEPDFLQVQIQGDPSLSVWEADAVVRRVEDRVRGVAGIGGIYGETIGTVERRLRGRHPEDLIGILQLELGHWRVRPSADEIIADLRRQTAEVPGIIVQVRRQERGPRPGRPIVIELFGRERAVLREAVARVRTAMNEIGGFADVEDDLPRGGVELALRVDRQEIARYGADIAALGQALRVVADGVLLGRYRPEAVDEEIDIRLRYPLGERDLGQLARLRIATAQGLVPIANFVTFEPAPATGLLKRIGGRAAYTIEADAAPGALVADQLARLREALATRVELPAGVQVVFAGEAEEQEETADFFRAAVIFALLLMVAILVTQLNSFFQAGLVLSAIAFSTAGVLLALLVVREPFVLVMSGVGILALAGIVVNTNIVLIDTYNMLRRRRDLTPVEAALRTGAQRLRPVVLTAVTTMAGLTPMMLGLTIDFAGRDVHIGSPATQYWQQLASVVIGGLLVATPLTLIVTPTLLAWKDGRARRAWSERRAQLGARWKGARERWRLR